MHLVILRRVSCLAKQNQNNKETQLAMWRVALERSEDWDEGEEKIPVSLVLVLLHPNADKKRGSTCTFNVHAFKIFIPFL